MTLAVSLVPAFKFAGMTGAEMTARDWSGTSLGPIEARPLASRSALTPMLPCPTPMFLAWRQELPSFYNDAYRPVLGYRLDNSLKHQLAFHVRDERKNMEQQPAQGGQRVESVR